MIANYWMLYIFFKIIIHLLKLVCFWYLQNINFLLLIQFRVTEVLGHITGQVFSQSLEAPVLFIWSYINTFKLKLNCFSPNPEIQTKTHVHVFGLWEEARVPRGYQCRHEEKIQTLHRKDPSQSVDSEPGTLNYLHISYNLYIED